MIICKSLIRKAVPFIKSYTTDLRNMLNSTCKAVLKKT